MEYSDGWCFVECVRYLLDLPELEIPEHIFHEDNSLNWENDCRVWLRENYEIEMLNWGWTGVARNITQHLRVIVTGDTTKEGEEISAHAVVYQDNKLLWNPSGEEDLPHGVEAVYIFVPTRRGLMI